MSSDVIYPVDLQHAVGDLISTPNGEFIVIAHGQAVRLCDQVPAGNPHMRNLWDNFDFKKTCRFDEMKFHGFNDIVNDTLHQFFVAAQLAEAEWGHWYSLLTAVDRFIQLHALEFIDVQPSRPATNVAWPTDISVKLMIFEGPREHDVVFGLAKNGVGSYLPKIALCMRDTGFIETHDFNLYRAHYAKLGKLKLRE